MWVVLVVRILNEESDRGSNNASLRKCLDQIPSELHKLFEDILQRGIQDDENLIPILQWVSFAQWPLACEELYFAVRSDRPDFDVSKPWDQDEDDTETMRLFILNSSKGLAELTRGKKPTVQFIHESVRDYLHETGFRVLSTDLHNSLFGFTHDYLKWCCSRWITDDVIEKLGLPQKLPKAKSQEAKELRDKAATFFPFLEYSVNHLIQHAELACVYGMSQAGFVFSFPEAQWTVINNLLAIHDTRRYEGPRELKMCIFAGKGASRILGERLAQGWRPTYDYHEQILRVAVTNGNVQALRLMLETPSQCEWNFSSSYELLKLSIDKSNAMALRIILSHTRHDVTTDMLISRAYHTMKQDLVNELYAWPGLKTHDKWQWLFLHMKRPSSYNALTRFLSIQLRALLENFAEANLMIDDFVSWLPGWRGWSFYRLILEALVEVELTSHAASHERRSAMVSACVQGFRFLVSDLLDEGYRIDLMDGASYFDALSGASRNGHADALEIFLAHDPDIELQEADSYREVVQAVTMGRFGKVLELLLDRSRGFRAQDRAIYRGPLRQATQLGFNDIVQILRERGVTLPEDGATELELPSSVA